MTTETLHTVIQYKYKHYEKMSLFSSHFYTKCKGCFGNQEFILPPFRYEVLIFTLDIDHNCVIVFTTVPWYWRTLETFGTGLMHNINERKQTSQWFTNQTEDIIVSYDLTYNIPPHALHNSLEFSYITYMLHSLISYFTDIKANISQCKV